MLRRNIPVSEGGPLGDDPNFLTPQDALVALMIATSASDEHIRTVELISIERIVDHMPIFADYDKDRLRVTSTAVFDLFEEQDGLDALFGLIREALPERLYETGYALACDVAASDGLLGEQELRFLAEIRFELRIDRLHAAAIERGARARHQT
jgi:tellurite resistance protein